MAVIHPSQSMAHARLLVAARIFGALSLLTLAVLERSEAAVLVSSMVVLTSVVAVLLPRYFPQWATSIPVVEAMVAAVLATVFITDTLVGLPYVVVPVFAAGLTVGVVGLSVAWFAQTGLMLLILLLKPGIDFLPALEFIAPWLLTSVAAGVLGAWVRITSDSSGTDTDAYDSAHRLLSELRLVARKLSAGLDPVGIGHQIIADVNEVVQEESSVLLVRSAGGTLLPLASRGVEDLVPEGHDDALVMECWTSEQMAQESVILSGRRAVRIALPLQLGNRMIAVLVMHRPTSLDPQTTLDVVERLRRHAVQLDTAMVFDEVRSLATIDERRRLAREIHDGIAQEVASLGYYVDSLMAESESEEQREGLAGLRDQLTHLVSELRLSIFDLRSEVTPGNTLGSVLADYVHQVGRQTGMTVHLSLNETPQRLRVEVETEILRIAQEAITNARRHSGASHLWVTFSADPPQATLSITDDGAGLGQAREDSFGMKIMRERAERIGADLAVVSEADRGTSVALTLMTTAALRRDDSPGHQRKDPTDADVGLAHR